MAEQNRYARTNIKFTPLQPFSNTGIPPKSLNKSSVYSDTKNTIGDADVLLINNTNIIENSSIPRHNIARETKPFNVIQKLSDEGGKYVSKTSRKANTNRNTKAKAYFETNKPNLQKDAQREQKWKSDKQMIQTVSNKHILNETQENNERRVSELTCLGKTQTSYTVLDNKENGKLIRPKSARPESRWERRFYHDVESDEEFLVSCKTPRPKSARPDSSMVQLVNHNSQFEFESDNSYSSDLSDIPSRPKTGHGRRRSSITNSEDDVWSSTEINIEERPSSRLVNTSNNKKDKVQEGKQTSNNFASLNSDLSTDSEHDGNSNDFTSNTCNKNKYIISTQPPNDTSSRQVREINYGVDDIDLNVDPVLYFQQEDNVPLTRSIKKPSLSKDTIGFIGNTKSSLQSKANIGCYGNYQNKANAITENHGRNNRNRLLSPQNTLHGRNISLQSGNDRLSTGAAGVNNLTVKQFGSYITAPKGHDFLSKSRQSKGSVTDFRTNGGYRQSSTNMHSHGVIQDTKINTDKVNRKPRKLQPISYSFR